MTGGVAEDGLKAVIDAMVLPRWNGESAWQLRLEAAAAEGLPDSKKVRAEIDALWAFRNYEHARRAAEELAAMLLGVHPELTVVQIAITGDTADPTRVRLDRSAATRIVGREGAIFGHVDILLENDEAGLYLLQIDPGKEIPRHHHQLMRELEWRVSGSVERDRESLAGMQPVQWPHGQIHGYRNVGEGVATIFCCDMPSFVRSDEIYEKASSGQADASTRLGR